MIKKSCLLLGVIKCQSINQSYLYLNSDFRLAYKSASNLRLALKITLFDTNDIILYYVPLMLLLVTDCEKLYNKLALMKIAIYSVTIGMLVFLRIQKCWFYWVTNLEFTEKTPESEEVTARYNHVCVLEAHILGDPVNCPWLSTVPYWLPHH